MEKVCKLSCIAWFLVLLFIIFDTITEEQLARQICWDVGMRIMDI